MVKFWNLISIIPPVSATRQWRLLEEIRYWFKRKFLLYTSTYVKTWKFSTCKSYISIFWWLKSTRKIINASTLTNKDAFLLVLQLLQQKQSPFENRLEQKYLHCIVREKCGEQKCSLYHQKWDTNLFLHLTY